MGISKSRALHVSFSRSSLCYTAGEKITGLISFHNTRKKFILNGVFLELIGELGYTTQKTDYIYDGLDSSHLEYRTVYHQISFLTIRHPIIYPKDNEVKNQMISCIFLSYFIEWNYFVSWSIFLAIRISSSSIFTTLNKSIKYFISLYQILRTYYHR